jgi:hypothetical protein
VDAEFMRKFNTVRSLLSTKYPKGMTFETIFAEMMDEYLDRHSPAKRIERRKKKNGRSAGSKSKKSNEKSLGENSGNGSGRSIEKRTGKCTEAGSRNDIARVSEKNSEGATSDKNKKRSRHIPASVRDEVFARDGVKCTFVGDNGRRCNSRWNLQIDHIVPYARGGDNSLENLRLLCARHNRLAAELEYGKEHMNKYHRRE